MASVLDALLSLTRFGRAATRQCRDCLDQAIREELASMTHARDVADLACTESKKGA